MLLEGISPKSFTFWEGIHVKKKSYSWNGGLRGYDIDMVSKLLENDALIWFNVEKMRI